MALTGLAVLCALRALLSAAYYRANAGVPFLFGDDALIAARAAQWAAKPTFWVERHNLPLGDWLMGLGFMAWGDAWVAPLAVNTLLAVAGMALGYRLSRELFPKDGLAAALTAGLVGFHPASLIQGLGAMEIPAAQACVLGGCAWTLRALRTGRPAELLAAALFFPPATAARYDAWFPAAVFSAFVLARARRSRGRALAACAGALVLVWSFAGLWLWRQWALGGAPQAPWMRPEAAPALRGAASAVVELLEHFPFVLLLSAAAIQDGRRRDARLFLLFPGFQLAALAACFAAGALRAHCHYTHLSSAGMMLAPFAAAAASAWVRARPPRRGRLAWACALSGGLMAARFLVDAPRASSFSAASVRAAWVLGHLMEEGVLEGGRVLVQTPGWGAHGESHLMDYALFDLAAPSLRPWPGRGAWSPGDRILYDRGAALRLQDGFLAVDRTGNPSVLELEAPRLSRRLEEWAVRAALVSSPEAAGRLAGMVEVGRLPPYRLLLRRGDPLQDQARSWMLGAGRRPLPLRSDQPRPWCPLPLWHLGG